METIKYLIKGFDGYPKKLLDSNESPDVLLALGDLSLLDKFSLAIVGSRNFTLIGKSITENLVTAFCKKDIVIVSGLAKGIDSIAHKTTLKNNGKTIAILANGFNTCNNKKLMNEILEKGGLILSQYFPDDPPRKYNYPKRNAIISGISDGVIVTQSQNPSGSLITANCALAQSKPLFTIPASIDDDNFTGNNYLLTIGARCILSYKDVFGFYKINCKDKELTNTIISIPDKYSHIYKLLKKTPIHISNLESSLQMSLQDLQFNLTMMEIEGLIIKHPNSFYSKK